MWQKTRDKYSRACWVLSNWRVFAGVSYVTKYSWANRSFGGTCPCIPRSALSKYWFIPYSTPHCPLSTRYMRIWVHVQQRLGSGRGTLSRWGVVNMWSGNERKNRDSEYHCYTCIAVTSSPRPWIAVFVLPLKINGFQHGGDWERSRPQGPKNVHNFLMALRKISWAFDLVAEMLRILKHLFSTWLFGGKF